MKIQKVLTLAAALLFCSLAYAHEFWLEPVKFWLKKDEKARIDLMVGEDYTGEHSNGHKYKILKLDHYGKGGKQDIRSKVDGDSLSRIDVAFATEGTAAGAPRSTEVAVAAPTTKNKTGECFGRSEWRE